MFARLRLRSAPELIPPVSEHVTEEMKRQVVIAR